MPRVVKISSDCVELRWAFEESIGVLPSSASDNLWYPLTVMTVSDFAPVNETISSRDLGSGRTPLKGTVVGKTSAMNFELGTRQRNIQNFMPGFFFAKPDQSGTTEPYGPVTRPNITSVTSSTYVADSWFTSDNKWEALGANTLVLADGFDDPDNNGLKVVSAISATTLTTTGLTAASTIADAARLSLVGTRGPATLAVAGSSVSLTSAIKEGIENEPVPGSFVFIGGDGTNQFQIASKTASTGFARVQKVTATGLDLDICAFNPQAATGTIDVYLPTMTCYDKKECGDEQRTTFQFEAFLGKPDTDPGIYDHQQTVRVIGAVANEFSFAIPPKSELNSTYGFLAQDSRTRTGIAGDPDEVPVSQGRLVNVEDLSGKYNTSYNIIDIVLYRKVASTFKEQAEYRPIGCVTDGTFTISNNASYIDCVGVAGAAEVQTGGFSVTGSLTALFTDVTAIRLIEQNDDAGFYMVAVKKMGEDWYAGFVIDLPLLTISNGSLSLAIDAPITITIDKEANRSDEGHAAMVCFFDYLPAVAFEGAGQLPTQ